MKVIIAGSRDIYDIDFVRQAVKDSGFEVTRIISGGARGVDAAGERIAEELEVPLKIVPADWEKHGHSAGIIRNYHMAELADALVAVWDGKSRGTKSMIDRMEKLGKLVFVARWPAAQPSSAPRPSESP